MSSEKPAKRRLARRLARIPESKTGTLLQSAFELRRQGNLIDLALGAPDYPAPDLLVEAAKRAITDGANGYGPSAGNPKLRSAVASRVSTDQSLTIDPDREVTITAGASAALNATLLALLNPGDQAIVFEPFYEYFLPQLALAGARPSFARLSHGDWRVEKKELKKALTKKCRVLILNNPHNPTGRVFSLEELEVVARFCQKHGLIAVCDETYVPFSFDTPFKSLSSLPGMKERCVVIHSVSKIFNVAGWRVGSVIAPPDLSAGIRRINALSLGAATPLQEACVAALDQYQEFMHTTVAEHALLRDKLSTALQTHGFSVSRAEGTLSVFAGASPLGFLDSDGCCRHLLQKHGILAAPGNNFFRTGHISSFVRFSFARSAETIEKAIAALARPAAPQAA